MSPPASDPAPSAVARSPAVAAAVIAAVCLSFAAFTGHMWEDYLITFRASLNLATGHGLVFQQGERVHTFTSPLGTLLPAAFALGGGAGVAERALWCLRVGSAAALAGAAWMAARTMLRSQLAPLALGAGCALLAFDPKIIDFSINGMEVAFLVLFVVITWRAFADGPRLVPCALGFAGLQWTRPDGCVFFAAVAGAWLVCGAPGEGPLRQRLGVVVRGMLLGILIYLPWVLFAWSYYGSPIPHTIVAKVSPWAPGELAKALALYPWRLFFGNVALHKLFMPAYFFFGGWPEALNWFSRIVAVFAAVTWLVPRVRPAGRLASAAFFLGGFYVEYIPRSPWYYPGWLTLAWLAWAYLLDAALRPSNSARGAGLISVGRVVAGLVVAVQAGLLVAVAWQMREQQAVIESGHRREIGRWLHDHATSPLDRVYLEPLGYIGYYSNLKMYDYPGLSSPEVVAARRRGLKPHGPLVAGLRPEWIALRPNEAREIMGQVPGLLEKDYHLARIFDVRPQVDAIRVLPGRAYLEFDAVFLVYHRVDAPAPRP